MVAPQSLNLLVGVRVPIPQPKEKSYHDSGRIFLLYSSLFTIHSSFFTSSSVVTGFLMNNK